MIASELNQNIKDIIIRLCVAVLQPTIDYDLIMQLIEELEGVIEFTRLLI